MWLIMKKKFHRAIIGSINQAETLKNCLLSAHNNEPEIFTFDEY